MLEIRRLEIEGFGPFADRERLDFPSDEGVTVVYGENMRGKTSLLNAIRYAFFGEVLGRGSRTRKLHTISNRDLATRGVYGFSVTLFFAHDQVEYELVRSCHPRVDEPESDADYREEVLLRRGSTILGPNERDHHLALVFPQEISRFFLFDGELLQEYEELLSSESEAGRKISQAIERILGVPILKRGRSHLVQLAETAEREAARQARDSDATRNLGEVQEQAMEMRDAHQLELSRKREELDALLSEQTELEQFLLGVQRYESLLDERRTELDRQSESVEAETDARQALRSAMSGAWRSVLRERVRVIRAEAQEKAAEAARTLVDGLKLESAESGLCVVCDRPIEGADLDRLRANGTTSSDRIQEHAGQLFARVGQLNQFDDTDNRAEIEQAWRDLRSAQVTQVDARERLRELNSELEDSNPEQIGRSRSRYRDVAQKIAAIGIAVEDEEGAIEELESSIQERARQISQMGSPDIEASQRKARIIREAADVFAGAIERYKLELRRKVELTASELFLAMTTERDDFTGLRINDGYGLSITHQDGREEEARSAGAEHVVALALMGALQQNAPLQGPIVMDSPFGRLDAAHTANVVAALPKMARQVVLFVYESEVGVDQMREVLRGSLLKEYRLDRQSSRRTRILELR